MAVDGPPIEERAGRLIDRLRDQERRAADALVRAHYDRVHRYLARLLGDTHAAEDLTQDTFLRAYEALPHLADDTNLSGWLFRIATNLARKHYRRRRLVCWTRLPHAEAPHHAPHASTLEDDVAAQDEVRRALDQLPLDQRACLLLYAWTGYTCAEIGQIMGRSATAVRMLLVRARRRFRAAYAGAIVLQDGDERGADPASDADATGGASPRRSGTGSGRPGRVAGQGVAGGAASTEEACLRVQEALPLLPRGDLPRDAFSAVTDHVRRCRQCHAALLDVQSTYRCLQAYVGGAGSGGARRQAALLVRLHMITAVREPSAADQSLEVREPVWAVTVAVPRGLT